MQIIIPSQILSYMYINERSVVFKIRENPFSAGLCPDNAGAAHDATQTNIVGWGGDTSSHISPHSAPITDNRSRCVKFEIVLGDITKLKD